MPQQPSTPDPALPAPDRSPPAAADHAPDRAPAGGARPADAAHDLSDSSAHARSPEEYTEEPGSHRRDADGAALDVGG